MTQIKDFQKITEEYANRIARERNTAVDWVSLDGKRPALRRYPNKKLSYTLGNFRFDWGDPSSRQVSMNTQRLKGDSNRVEKTFARSEKRKDTYTTSVTAGLKIGVDLVQKVTVKFLETNMTQKIEINLSTTATRQTEDVRTWTVTQTFVQRPQYSTRIDWFLDTKSAKCDYRVNVVVSGSAAIWFRDPIEWFDGTNKHNLWFPDPGRIVREARPEGFTDDGFRANFRASGIIEADVGINSRLLIEQHSGHRLHTKKQVAEYILSQDGEVLHSSQATSRL